MCEGVRIEECVKVSGWKSVSEGVRVEECE